MALPPSAPEWIDGNFLGFESIASSSSEDESSSGLAQDLAHYSASTIPGTPIDPPPTPFTPGFYPNMTARDRLLFTLLSETMVDLYAAANPRARLAAFYVHASVIVRLRQRLRAALNTTTPSASPVTKREIGVQVPDLPAPAIKSPQPTTSRKRKRV